MGQLRARFSQENNLNDRNTENSNAVSKIWKVCSLRTGSNGFNDALS